MRDAFLARGIRGCSGLEIVAVSEPMLSVLRQVETYGPYDVPVLIGGESGTGKELVAKGLHAASPRRRSSFVAVNAAALPDTLVEAELFGHARGAFTGADRQRPGLLEEADGGTLFIDEVGDLSPRAQTTLLRALQEKEYRRLGESAIRRSDFRLVTATHKNLQAEVQAGRFRGDLFFRLEVVRIEIAPLRERPADVVPIAELCLGAKARSLGLPKATLSREAREILLGYAWPGNVRELENELTQALLRLGHDRKVRPEHLSPSLREKKGARCLRALSLAHEKRVLTETLRRSGGNRSRAARDLGVSRQSLYRKLKRHGIVETSPSAASDERR